MLTADFNGDRHPDVLIVDAGRSLAVFLSNGSGPFSAPVVTPITQATGVPGIGDVNGDGRVDVVVTDWSSGTAGVLLGNGDGSFSLGATLITGPLPGPAAVGDFNGDSFADIAIGATDSHGGANPLRVYLGDGTGRFSNAIPSCDIEASQLVVADLNRDGKSDLLVNVWTGSEAVIAVGDGTFTRKSGSASGGIAVADFNHDSIPDVAVAAGGYHDWFVEVRMGNGDGTLGAATLYPAGYEADSIAVADVDSDGNPDLLAAGTAGSTVTVLRGNANGTFRRAEYFLSGPSAWRIVAGDFDWDGAVDFVTVDYNAEIWSLSFVRGNGDGTFRSYRACHTNDTVPVVWPGLKSAGGIAADMNNDNHLDVVVIQQHPNAYPFDLAVLPGDGTGKLAPPIITPTTRQEWSGVPQIAVGDVNHDGNNDVVAIDNLAYTPSGETFVGDGTGHFAAGVRFSLTTCGGVNLANFDGDSNLDLVVAGGYRAVLHHGNGDGTFGAGVAISGSFSQLLVGDLNGDGRADMVGSEIRSTVAYLNDGTGQFRSIPVTGDEITVAALADFNGDGKPDLLFTTYSGTQVRFGNGDGTFGAPISFTISPVPNYPFAGPVATADIDGDGKVDVAFGSTVYLGNGDGTFRASARFRTNGTGNISLADMDENGTPDLLLQKQSADDIDILTTYTTNDPTEPSSLTLTASTETPTYAERVTVTADVTGSAVPLAGTVAFSIDGTPFGIIAVDANGRASIANTFLVGSHDVVATYVGDENYRSSTATRHLDVAKAPTSLQISGSPNPQPKGRTVTVQVSLAANSFGSLAGEVAKITLRDGDVPLAVTLVNGRASLTMLDVGTHVIHADYPGSDNFEPSTASYTQTITKPVPALLLSANPATTTPVTGTVMQFRLYFQNSDPLTGTISFNEGDTVLGTAPLINNQADFQVTPKAGPHSFQFRYSGDDTWAPAQRNYSCDVLLVWGSPQVTATGYSTSAYVSWVRVNGAASYTVWRKTSAVNPWEIAGTYSGSTSSTYVSAPNGTSALFAVTATDGSGIVSAMSAPDLATMFWLQDATVTIVKAQHFQDVRTMIQCVRAFAGLAPFAYTNEIQVGQPVRAIDMMEQRAALIEARNAIGLPPITFTDSITLQGSLIRAAHILELRAGAN